jgi:hypothetical protein
VNSTTFFGHLTDSILCWFSNAEMQSEGYKAALPGKPPVDAREESERRPRRDRH